MELVSILLKTKREGERTFKNIQLRDYQKKVFSMYGEEVKAVTMAFSNRLMNVVVDRFGKSIIPLRVDDEHFKITEPVAVSLQFYAWLVGLEKDVIILEPIDVRDAFLKELKDIQNRYLK